MKKKLKAIFISFLVTILVFSSPIVGNITNYNNIGHVTKVVTQLDKIIPTNQILNLSYSNQQYIQAISSIQRESYGFIMIIFQILAFLAKIIIQIIMIIVRIIIKIVTFIISILPTILRFLMKGIMFLIRGLMSVFRAIGRALPPIFRGIGKLMGSLFKGVKVVFRSIGKGLGKILKSIKSVFKGIIKFIKNIFRNIAFTFRKLFSSIGSIFKKGSGKKIIPTTSGVMGISKVANAKKIVTAKSGVTGVSKLTNTKKIDVTTPKAKLKASGKSSLNMKNVKKAVVGSTLGYSKNYSMETNKFISNSKEKKLYKKLSLKETTVKNRKILRRDDLFDINQKDSKGRSNLERMRNGIAPLDKNGKSIELHHVGQKMNSPLAELTYDEHKSNYKLLHKNLKESQIDRNKFEHEKREHWKEVASKYDI